MSTKVKRLLVALVFLVLAVLATIQSLGPDHAASSPLYAVVFAAISALFIKNAFRP